MSYWRHILALAVLLLTPLAYVWKYVRASSGVQGASWDIYAEAYPTMIQAVAAVRDGGRGLLWNAMQNCGQPFFGSGITGLLYPGNFAYFVTDPDSALYVMLAFNFAVACVSAYFLCLELGLGSLAACCGGLCFGIGASSVSFATAAPLLGVPYVWFPAAMLFCERSLRSPSVASTLGLAVTIAIFRLVPVAAGDSMIDFRYSPTSLKLGAATSIVAWMVAAGLVFLIGRQRALRVARPLPEAVPMR